MSQSPPARLTFDDTTSTLRVDGEAWLAVAQRPDAAGVSTTVTGPTDGALDVVSFAMTAVTDLTLAPTGFAEPGIVWPALVPTGAFAEAGGWTFGYQYMEFGLPNAGAADGLGLAPWPLRPAAAFPIVWTRPGGPSLVVGPLDHFHDQVMAVPSAERQRTGVACGWHGDLERVPAGFTTTIVALIAPDPRAAVDAYGRMVSDTHHARPTGRYADPGVSGVSYWTDNGATYYYRGDADRSYRDTLVAAVQALRDRGVPVHALQLDSWFYPHQILRGIGLGAPSVPSTGSLAWEARDDGVTDIAELHHAIGDVPMIFHNRHLHRDSTYFGLGGMSGWIDPQTGHAHPADAELYEMWMEQVAAWGGCTYEQDWLVEMFLTVRDLRREPGRARAWQAMTDAAAARRGLTLQWCMATPADLLGTVHLSRVSSVRTSMDFDYAVDRPANWGWFLHVNALARSLGLNASKDVFLASTGPDGSYQDRLAEAETLLAAMSCGPVGLGDPIGTTDRELVMRTCRADGVLVMPDAPVAALADTFTDPMPDSGTLWGETYTDHPAGRTHYVMALHAGTAAATSRPLGAGDLDHGGAERAAAIACRWTTREVRPPEEVVLDPGDRSFDLWCVAPLLADGRIAVFGDLSRYASMGDRRIGHLADRGDGLVTFLVLGSAGETVSVHGWSTVRPSADCWRRAAGSEPPSELTVAWEQAGGTWNTTATVGELGWARVRLRVD